MAQDLKHAAALYLSDSSQPGTQEVNDLAKKVDETKPAQIASNLSDQSITSLITPKNLNIAETATIGVGVALALYGVSDYGAKLPAAELARIKAKLRELKVKLEIGKRIGKENPLKKLYDDNWELFEIPDSQKPYDHDYGLNNIPEGWTVDEIKRERERLAPYVSIVKDELGYRILTEQDARMWSDVNWYNRSDELKKSFPNEVVKLAILLKSGERGKLDSPLIKVKMTKEADSYYLSRPKRPFENKAELKEAGLVVVEVAGEERVKIKLEDRINAAEQWRKYEAVVEVEKALKKDDDNLSRILLDPKLSDQQLTDRIDAFQRSVDRAKLLKQYPDLDIEYRKKWKIIGDIRGLDRRAQKLETSRKANEPKLEHNKKFLAGIATMAAGFVAMAATKAGGLNLADSSKNPFLQALEDLARRVQDCNEGRSVCTLK